jgi:hypothetical protein
MLVELSDKDWPVERKWIAAGRSRARYVGDLSKAVYQKYGEEGLKLVGEVYAKMAERVFLKGLKAFDIKGKDAKAFATYFKLAQEVLGYKMEIPEASEKRAIIRWHTCHLFDKPDPVGHEICKQANSQFEKKAAELLNPKLRFKFTKFQTAGDPYCEAEVWLEE